MTSFAVRACRHVLHYVLFARSLGKKLTPRGDMRAYNWVVEGCRRQLAAVTAPQDSLLIVAAWRAVHDATERLASARGDAILGALRDLDRAARAFLREARPKGALDRALDAAGIAWGFAQKLSLTLLSGLAGVAMILGSSTIETLVLYSRSGRYAYAVLVVLGGAMLWRLLPLTRGWTFWSPHARPPNDDATWPPTLIFWRMTLRLFIELAIGLVALIVVGIVFAAIDPRSRCPYAIVAVLGVMHFGCFLLDVLDYFEPRPVRLIGGLFGGAALLAVTLIVPDDSRWKLPKLVSSEHAWVSPSSWPKAGEGPVVVIAASGGGSRAAIFVSQSLLAMERETPDAARAIQAISAVSGGSLAASGYVAVRVGALEKDAYEKAMFADYLWPVLRAIVSREGRGEALVRAWNEELHTGALTLSGLAQKWMDPAAAPFPLPFFNASDVDGHHVVLSPIDSVQADAEDRTPCGEIEGDRRAWVCNRDATHSIQQLVPGSDVPLADAVRASANLPFAFPLIPVKTNQPILGHAGQAESRRTRITDGAVYSNSGFATLYYLLLSHAKELRQRGIIVVILDASAASPTAASPGELDALAAVARGGVARSQQLHRVMIDRLSKELGGRFACVLVDPDPHVLATVPTTWYLNPSDQQHLRAHFSGARWGAQRRLIHEAWEAVGKESSAAAEHVMVESCLARPPLY